MQAQGSEGRIVIGEELTFKSTPVLELHTCESVWDELVDGDVTATADTSVFKKGTKSLKLVVATTCAANDILATDNFTAKNLSSYGYIGFWIRSSVALAAGDLKILLDDTALCASPLETLDVPAVATVDTWQFCKVALANPASDTAIISIGIEMAVDKGAFTVYFDQFEALNRGILIPFISEDFGMSRNLINSDAIRSSRNPQAPTRGKKEVAGSLNIELNPWMNILFKHLFGSQTTTGGGSPYTHTFKIGSLPTGLVVEKQFSDIAQYFVYNGCKVNQFTLDVPVEGPIKGAFQLMGSKETVATLPWDSSPVDRGHIPFDAFEATINEGGSALGTVTSVSMQIVNNLDGNNFVIDGTGERYSMPAGKVVVSGKLQALFQDTTLYTKALNHTETSLQVVLTKGTGAGTAGNEKATFDFDEVVFKPTSPKISGPAGILIDLEFIGYYNDAAAASAARLTLLNALSSL